jgi:hypothetical protein
MQIRIVQKWYSNYNHVDQSFHYYLAVVLPSSIISLDLKRHSDCTNVNSECASCKPIQLI